MKLTVILIMALCLDVSAEAYAQRISLSLTDASLEETFEQIRKQSDYDFIYHDDILDKAKSISVVLEQKPIETILDYIFSDQSLTYKIIDKIIYIQEKESSISEEVNQQKTISGRVTDSTGAPLPGVSVQVKGTLLGASTNLEGRYQIENIPQDVVLIFSLLGYKTQEVTWSGQTVLDMIMQQDLTGLDEVVVVGYGTQRVREVTSSISHLNEKDFAKSAIYNSPLQLLSGRIAGLALSRAGGGNPNAGVQVQLRGVSSIRGNTSPLVVIDGVPGGSLSSLSPESIESISVLRDGSAAAIYGTRANAGVIIISTKRGNAGNPQVSYSTYLYTERYVNKPDYLTADQYRNLKDDWGKSGDSFLQSLANTMIDYGHNTDWFEVISQKALSQVHNVAISGGTKSSKYYGALNYRRENGLIKGTGQNTLNGKLTLTQYALNDKLRVKLDLNNSFINSRPFDGEIMAQPFFRYNSPRCLDSIL